MYTYFFNCSLDETIGDYYYFNVNSGETQWAHPLDEIYKQKVTLARQQFEVENDAKVTGLNPEGRGERHENKEDVTEVSEDLDDNTSDILSNLAKTKVDVPDLLSNSSSPMKLVSQF